MRLNDNRVSGLVIKVKDHISCKEFGVELSNYCDSFHLPEILEIDDYEFDRLVESLLDMKRLIEEQRVITSKEFAETRRSLL